MDLTWDEVRDVLRLIDEAPLEELELEIGDVRLVVRKRPAGAAPAAVTAPASREGQFELKSPTVGVFHPPPLRGAAPFVTPGAIAEAGEVLALIAMLKEVRAVSAPRRVRVVAILVEDRQFVEYGQPLMLLEPAP